MKLIDIDKVEVIEDHIHYIRVYDGSAIFMDKKSAIFRHSIQFTVEHKPLGAPVIKVKFIDHPHIPVVNILQKVKEKIIEMEKNGILAASRKKRK